MYDMSFIQGILSLLPSVTVVESLMTYVCLLLLSIMFNINIYVYNHRKFRFSEF